ncbi:MAG: amino acid permease, partial [Clostridium sp.]
IVTIYAMYIPIFIMMMKNEKELGVFKRFVAPALAVCACIFMIIAACYAHGTAVVYYLIVFAVIMGIGLFLMNPKEK